MEIDTKQYKYLQFYEHIWIKLNDTNINKH